MGAKASGDPDADAVVERGVDADYEFQTPTIEVTAPPAQPFASVLSTPAETPAPTVATLTLEVVTFQDVDRLWDWIRQDQAGATRFLGAMPQHSRALQDYISNILDREVKAEARIRSIYLNGPEGSMHVGFVSLMPIVRVGATPSGWAHCYLCPAAQGSLPKLLPDILAEAGDIEPDLTLIVSTSDYAFAKLLEPHGFTLSIALTRPPASAQRK